MLVSIFVGMEALSMFYILRSVVSGPREHVLSVNVVYRPIQSNRSHLKLKHTYSSRNYLASNEVPQNHNCFSLNSFPDFTSLKYIKLCLLSSATFVAN